ncbi:MULTISPECIES: ABC transporter permease [Nonomuraea]|uniref:ABC transporter permease n=1 Tax=Nonomuraea mangrovi TaxID=2316207 RepID=A0ABW4SJX3_9ACTN
MTLRSRGGRTWGRRVDVTLAVVLLALLVLAAVLAPIIAPYDPTDQDLLHRLEGPGAAHWLGTDESGRDVLSRLLYGTRVSLGASLLAVAVAVTCGVPSGVVAGYLGRGFDLVVSRVADAALSIPGLVLAIAIATALGPSLTNAMIAVGLVYAPGFYRVARGATIAVRGRTYVEAAITTGCSTPRIIVRHVLPNVRTPLVVKTFLTFGYAILAEASLSFLGIGVQPPEASWGSMLKRAVRHLEQAPLLVILPGLVILAAVLAFNTIGDGLRDTRAHREREPS